MCHGQACALSFFTGRQPDRPGVDITAPRSVGSSRVQSVREKNWRVGRGLLADVVRKRDDGRPALFRWMFLCWTCVLLAPKAVRINDKKSKHETSFNCSVVANVRKHGK